MSTVEQSIEIDVPVGVAYDQWTQFESFPQFMDGVEEVRQLDDTHLHWRAEVAGRVAEWDAVITEQVPEERIAWRATDGKANGGIVTFARIGGASTRVTVQIEHESEGIMEKVGSALGADSREVKNSLESFKELVESRGQATGGWRGTVREGETQR
ncbi:MAG TPA: SRPBCC family protein [Polyangiaceae bacterium]